MKNVSMQSVLEAVHRSNPGVDVGSIDANTSLRRHGFDSMNIASLMLELEELYGIRIPDQDVEKLDTAEDIISYLATK